MEYAAFSGSIPAGEYGAGTMTIWDEGRYELEKWRDDEIIFTLEGRAGGPLGRVRLALIRTDGDGAKSTWLLHRMKTDAAGRPQPEGQPVVPIDETDDDERPLDHGPAEQATPPASELAPMIATAATRGLARDAARRWAIDGHPWVEMKWDGVRAIGLWDGSRLRLRARSGADITAKYPELSAADLGLGPDPAVVDGEIVALDEKGRPSFPLLQARMNLQKPREIAREAPRTPVKLYLFDVLSFRGEDTAGSPLAERRRILESLAERAHDPVVLPPVFDDLDAALETSELFGLEGVMLKDPRSRYRRGVRSEEWLKVKLTRTQEVVIGGIRPGKGGRSGSIGSLLVGIPGPAGLAYSGRVGSGFSESTLARLEEVLLPLRTTTVPFVDVPSADASDALWVRPVLVGEVEFAEFTPGGILRQARWRGLRPDKRPDEVVRES
jgi:bifunctional non-homologous end joining protein LigD